MPAHSSSTCSSAGRARRPSRPASRPRPRPWPRRARAPAPSRRRPTAPGRDQRRVLADAVADHEVGAQPGLAARPPAARRSTSRPAPAASCSVRDSSSIGPSKQSWPRSNPSRRRRLGRTPPRPPGSCGRAPRPSRPRWLPGPGSRRRLHRCHQGSFVHSITHDPQARPPPKPTISTVSPSSMRPPRQASSRQRGIEAAECCRSARGCRTRARRVGAQPARGMVDDPAFAWCGRNTVDVATASAGGVEAALRRTRPPHGSRTCRHLGAVHLRSRAPPAGPAAPTNRPAPRAVGAQLEPEHRRGRASGRSTHGARAVAEQDAGRAVGPVERAARTPRRRPPARARARPRGDLREPCASA